ncbi:MAG TPA: DUF1800 domain-containing protein [Acidimicrobiia bacterium]|nr:DUF1800 domain-containing protein [Acidimicrobiia bacterium]
MSVSDRERVSHVVRRLSVGAHPDVVGALRTTDDAIARALDLSAPAAPPPTLAPPATEEESRRVAAITEPLAWWIGRMRADSRLIEERLVWFWHDHFATSIAKVRVPYLMWQQHLTIRRYATGSFADLLHAMAKDPAMLVWLDGVTNTARQRNENFGRECMELFTLGRNAGYTQDDVVAASRAFTGWVVDVPFRRNAVAAGAAPYAAAFVPRRHDAGTKTLLGATGDFDLEGALDVILDHPAAARFVATKLHRELVGVDPDPPTVARLAATFRRDWGVLSLVEAIVTSPAFTSDAAVRAKVRTPLEKLVTLLQAVPSRAPAHAANGGGKAALAALRRMGYVPFAPPNVGGFPKGAPLLGPHELVHALDLLAAIGGPPPEAFTADVDALFARFGVFDVAPASRAVVASHDDPVTRVALVLTSPEVALT